MACLTHLPMHCPRIAARFGLLCAFLLPASSAMADDAPSASSPGKPASAVVSSSRARASSVPSDDAPPLLPPADVRLSLEAKAPEGPFTLRVENHGTAPVRLAADGRLLRLEITLPAPPPEAEAPVAPARRGRQPAAKKDSGPRKVTCMAPPGLRPYGVDEARAAILPAGAQYEESLDPLLLCFSKAEREALTAGATVVAKLGFAPLTPSPRSNKPVQVSAPFVVEPTALSPVVAPLKELVAAPIELPAPPPSPTPEAGDSAAPEESLDPGAPAITLEAPSHLDATTATDIAVTLTLTNRGRRPMLARLRPDNVIFNVHGPGFSAECRSTVPYRLLARDFFRVLRPGERETYSYLLAEICPNYLFVVPGLYRVEPQLLITDGGERLFIKAWTGSAAAKAPTVVRVRTGPVHYHRTPPVVTMPAASGSKAPSAP